MTASRSKTGMDGDPSVTLRDLADGAETVSVTETAISLNVNNDVVPYDVLTVAIHVTALDLADGDEEYSLHLLVDSDVGLPSPILVASTPITKTGLFYVKIDPDLIKDVDTDAKFIAIDLVVGGTTPSITYGAWIV